MSKLYRRGAERNIRKIIAKSHSADMAGVLESLETDERISIFQLVPTVEMKAQILSHMSQGLQEEISLILNPNEVQEILSQMQTDDAAALLSHLPEDLSKAILKEMPLEDVQEVEELMGYPDDSAGAMMTPEVLSFNESQTVSEAIQKIQDSDEDLISFYVYVVNDQGHLVGVLSLKQLILHKPTMILKDFMETGVIAVEVITPQMDVARIVEKYDFLALPVIDTEKKLVGVITVDDVIDVIREEASDEMISQGMAGGGGDETFWGHFRARLPWFFLCLSAGLICFFSLYGNFFRAHGVAPWEFVCMMPMALFLVTILSNQTATLSVDYLRSGKYKTEGWGILFKQEFTLAFFMGALLSIVSLILLLSLPVDNELYYLFSFSFLVLVLVSVLLSVFIPMGYQKWTKEVSVAAIPVSVIFSNVVSILILAIFGRF